MKLINQIYWDRINATYMNGTSLKKYQNESIRFKNYLMPAGKTIIKWSSSLNYQANKEVPRLPILLKGQKYRIVLDMQVVPVDTTIFCLRFFDLQVNEIKKIIFTEKDKEFVYPLEAVSYTFEIISGGCKEIQFNKFQLGEAGVPKETFDDFYPVILQKDSENPLGYLLLVEDSKRARELEEVTIPFFLKNYKIIIGYLSWQRDKDTLKKLDNFLSDTLKKYRKLEIISSSAKIDNLLGKQSKDLEFMSSKEFSDSNSEWLKEDLRPVDLQKIIDDSTRYLKEQ